MFCTVTAQLAAANAKNTELERSKTEVMGLMHARLGDVRLGSEAHRHDVTSYAGTFKDLAVTSPCKDSGMRLRY